MAMPRFVRSLAGAFAASFLAAPALANGAEALLLSEPMWLLQTENRQETVWFEQGPDGLVMARCALGANCRMLVGANAKGLMMGASGAGSLSLARGSGSVPYFADNGATIVLMPAWVVPAGGSRVGH